jgi:hypothetical protein
MVFGNNKGSLCRFYLAACAAAHLEILLLNGTTEEGGFFPTYWIQTLQSMYFTVVSWPGKFFILRNGVVGRTFV